jgi:hypothetical protein
MKNASRAFLDAVRKSMRQIRAVIGAATINPSLLTAAERIQYEGYRRREERQRRYPRPVQGRDHDQGDRAPHRAQPGLVRRILRGQRFDIFRARENSVERYLLWLDAQ